MYRKYLTQRGGYLAILITLSITLLACPTPSTPKPPSASSAKAITAFSFSSPSASGIIDEAAKTIAVTVPYNTAVSALKATFTTTGVSVTVGGNPQTSGTTANNFTSPVVYTVKAADGSTQNYTVTVTVAKNPAKAITAFSFSSPSASGIIDEAAKTISLAVAEGTSLTNLTPTIVHTGASINPASGAAQNFTNSVQYVVTAKDGSTQAYTVTVSITHAIVTPPSGGIPSVDPSYTLPEIGDNWKGVFINSRTVSLAKYAIANSEVTYKLWKAVYDWACNNGYTFANPGKKGSSGSGSDDEPVTEVSWRDVVVWCNAFTEKTRGNTDECVYRASAGGEVLKSATAQDSSSKFIVDSAVFDQSKKGYRLPTEAEWEYAARYQSNDSTTNAVKYGDVYLTKLDSASGAKLPLPSTGITKPSDKTWDALRDEASRVAVYDEWYNGSSWQNLGTSKTASVKSKAANALGLYDMSGNVYEWCWDWYGIISTSTPITGQEAATYRVYRGGGWYDYAFSVSVGCRSFNSPDYRYYNLGFRLAWKTE